MKRKYQPDVNTYHGYYTNQAGRGYPVYAGRRYQRGHGLGSILGGLFKSAVPLLKKGAKALGKEALRTGLNVAADTLEGGNVGESLKRQTKAAGRRVVNRATQRFTGPPGNRAIKREARQKRPSRRKTVKQIRRRDIFG